MVRRTRKKHVSRDQAGKYFRVARALRRAAEDLSALAEEGDAYGNAIGIVIVHAAIAYTDSLCIAYGGFKSVAGEHERAADALKDALGRRVDTGRIKNLQAILKEKDTISYQGVYYVLEDSSLLLQQLHNFADWAEGVYRQRP